MKEENKAFLEEHRHIYTTLSKAGFIPNLTNQVRQRLLDIIHQEFCPGYLCCMHCNESVAKMVAYVYIQYDKMLKAMPAPEKTLNDTTHGTGKRK